jgi:hypothetical protein
LKGKAINGLSLQTARIGGQVRRTPNPDAFFACEIPLPPLPEQRRIVARIEHLSAKITEARGPTSAYGPLWRPEWPACATFAGCRINGSPETQKALVQALVHRIELSPKEERRPGRPVLTDFLPVLL